ncbi:T4 RnlA family RNA ligase, partial [Catenulispora pinistramenti]|uniref:T4 RnlA family RNA ligase n=1 Tax=Catenulispora pinistramenti TaxID=2705254 RepID=UPI001E4C0A90
MSEQATVGQRPLLADVLDPEELAREIAAEKVARRTHPTLPLSIYSYSRACQYEQYWTPITTRTRGLIVDDSTGRVAAWCLPKFFNHGQHGKFDYAPPLPEEPFEVYDKVDGSLGIVFHHDGAWHAASKGSFISDQAAWAGRYLAKADTSALDPSVTYLAEIVYPEN